MGDWFYNTWWAAPVCGVATALAVFMAMPPAFYYFGMWAGYWLQ